MFSIALALVVIVLVEVSDREGDRYVSHHIIKSFTNLSQPFPLGFVQNDFSPRMEESAKVADKTVQVAGDRVEDERN